VVGKAEGKKPQRPIGWGEKNNRGGRTSIYYGGEKKKSSKSEGENKSLSNGQAN